MREFGAGVGYLSRGFGIVFRSPRLLLVGAIPALFTAILFVGALVALGYWIEDLATWSTPFADGWSAESKRWTRITAGLLIFVTALMLAVVLYTAVTLLIGGPFYEWIGEQVENQLGGVPGEVETSRWRSTLRGMRDSLFLVTFSLLLAAPLCCLGWVPVVGQVLAPVLVVVVGGWLLAIELVGVAFSRRGLRLRDRHRALRGRRALTLGFAVPVYVLCAVPLLPIVVMPAAVAGGTLLAREVLDGPAG